MVLRQPRAGDEDVACVLSLASLWEAQLADSSLAELRAEGRSCLQSFREVLYSCRVGGWERKGLRSQRGAQSGNLCPAFTVYSKVATAFSAQA